MYLSRGPIGLQRRFRLLLAAVLVCALPAAAEAQSAQDYVRQGARIFKPGDTKAMDEARVLFERALKLDPKNYEAAWRLAEVSYYQWESAAGWETDSGKKEQKLLDISRYGVQAGRLATQINPRGVEGLFWVSANLGLWGLINGPLDSLAQVPQILAYTKTCFEVDPEGRFERGGCYRIIGAVHTHLPGFPVSIGDRNLAAEYFEKSMRQGAGYGINHTLRAELLMARGEYAQAVKALEAAIRMMEPRKPHDYFDRRDLKRARDLLAIARGKVK